MGTSLAIRLKEPPLVEVVCGFFFPQLVGLDPLVVGKYWSAHKEKNGYTKHELHPAVAERPGISFTEGVGPIRSWLVKSTEDYILQPDRFYFNWRKRSGGYPHFNDWDGSEGVLTQSLREFDEFRRFCESEPAIKQSVTPVRLELVKVDLLVSSLHWKDYSDLASVVPMTAQLFGVTEEPALSLSLSGQRDTFQVKFGLTNTVLTPDMSQSLRIETRVTAKASEDPRALFTKMNTVANEVFFDTLNRNELHRFGGTSA